MKRIDTLYIFLCVCKQLEKEEIKKKNFLNNWIIIFFFFCLGVFSSAFYLLYALLALFQSVFSSGTMWFCFLNIIEVWNRKQSYICLANLIVKWWFILLCKEGIEMFWKGWSCIEIKSTGVKEVQQLLCSFLPEL